MVSQKNFLLALKHSFMPDLISLNDYDKKKYAWFTLTFKKQINYAIPSIKR